MYFVKGYLFACFSRAGRCHHPSSGWVRGDPGQLPPVQPGPCCHCGLTLQAGRQLAGGDRCGQGPEVYGNCPPS